jgi:hypothetical protein
MIELRGKPWDFIDVVWRAAEPDVGIMSEWVDGYDLEDEDGNRWDWAKDQLTDDEAKYVDAELAKLTFEPYDGEDYTLDPPAQEGQP